MWVDIGADGKGQEMNDKNAYAKTHVLIRKETHGDDGKGEDECLYIPMIFFSYCTLRCPIIATNAEPDVIVELKAQRISMFKTLKFLMKSSSSINERQSHTMFIQQWEYYREWTLQPWNQERT